MAKCNFKIPLPHVSKEVLDTAGKTIRKYKGTFEGDTDAGTFQIPVGIGDIHGDYTIADGVMNVNITKKPLVVTCSMIEKQLKKYMSPTED